MASSEECRSISEEGTELFAGSYPFESAVDDTQAELHPVGRVEVNSDAQWSITGGNYDPRSMPISKSRLNNILRSAEASGLESIITRVKAIDSTLFAVRATMPDEFKNPEKAEDIESSVIVAAKICSEYSENERAAMIAKSRAGDTAVVRLLDRIFGEGGYRPDPEVHNLTRSMTALIELKQTGRESEIIAIHPGR